MLSDLEITIEPGPFTLFGAGSLSRLPEAITQSGHRRVFLVTDKGIVGAGIARQVERVLGAAAIATTTFDGIRPNPGVADLDAGAEVIRAFGTGTVVAAGGGAVMDVAKALALMSTNAGAARDFDYRNTPQHPGLPVVALPTTAGTGSETNAWGVIDDPEAHRKLYIGHESVAPRAAILDPQLTLGLPPGQTAASGMDALVHAIESVSSRRSNPYADGLGLRVITMVAGSLPEAVSHGQNLEARAEMLLAAHMAGLGFRTTGLGLCHGIGHALSARLGTPHGVALSTVLPHVMAFNLPVRERAYAEIARAMGVSHDRSDDAGNAQAAIEAVRRLSVRVGLPHSLRGLGCTEALLPDLMDDILADVVLDNTPRIPSRDELRTLLEEAL
jgi:alcohol dehydrogenase class IV